MESDSSTGEGRDRAFGADTIEAVIRERVHATIEAIVEEQPAAALGATRSVRVGHGRLRELCGNGVPDGQASPLAASNFLDSVCASSLASPPGQGQNPSRRAPHGRVRRC
jgi:hypothetical protein